MKYIKKTFIIFLTVIFTLVTTACGNNEKSWALKSDNSNVSNGTYVYFLWIAYNNALKQISDGSESIQDLENQKIDNKDASTWIKENAINLSKDMLATEKLFEEKNLTLSDEENKKIDDDASKSFETSKETFEKHGVTLDDFKRAYSSQNMKSEKLFNSLYNKGGSEAVSDEDLLNYYKTSYASVSIISKGSESNSESSENNQSNNENTKSEDQIEEQFKNYSNMINNGEKSLSDIGNIFKESEKMDENPIDTETLNLKTGDIANEISTKISEIEVNKAAYLKIGSAFLLIFKNDINNFLPNISDENERNKILIEMKSLDFDAILKSKEKEMNIKINENSLKDYSPTKFFKEN